MKPRAHQAGLPTLIVTVGLPGAGKTRRAKVLEQERAALRLTPDEWMLPLFGESEAGDKRDVLEGRLVWVALRALELGLSVVLDFGVWSRVERSALRALAKDVGAECELVYLEVEEEDQHHRIAGRSSSTPSSTFPVSEEDLRRFRQLFEVPYEAELDSSSPIDPPPPGYDTWRDWAAERWPTSSA